MYYFKETFTFGFLLALASFQGYSQTSNNSLLPYNPDIDGNETIEATDLLGFLSYFGTSYIAEGALPIELGGTGASTIEEARLALTLSVFSDLPPVEGVSSGGQVSGTLNIAGALTQGEDSEATGSFSVGLNRSLASGDCSVAQGESTVATALGSHSEGMLTYSSGIGSHAEGMQTLAQADYTHSEGFQTQALNTSAHAEGYGSDASGLYSHAEGFQTQAENTSAHAEGYGTVASGLFSHAENRFTVANSTCAHAEGEGTSALADAAHSEGLGTTASGFASHAQGYQSISSGSYSHAGGRTSEASATGSTAMGNSVIADQQYSTVVGEYNLENIMGTLFVVGNGVHASSRSNIFEVSSSKALLNGDLNVNGIISSNGVNLETGIDNNQVNIQQLMLEIQNLQSIVADLQIQIDTLTP
jgi:hypothetical protein